jgi:hypothetical protein
LFFKNAFFIGLLAPLLDVLFFQDWPFNVAGSFDVFRNGSFACDLFNRPGGEAGTRCLGDSVNGRSDVYDNLFTCAVKIPGLMAEIDIRDTSAVDYGLVINDQHIRPYRPVENTDLHKDELRRGENHTTGS